MLLIDKLHFKKEKRLLIFFLCC